MDPEVRQFLDEVEQYEIQAQRRAKEVLRDAEHCSWVIGFWVVAALVMGILWLAR